MAGGRGVIDATTVVVGAVSGTIAGLAALVVSGGTGANPVLGAVAGLVVGALGGVATGALHPSAPALVPAVAGRTAPSGLEGLGLDGPDELGGPITTGDLLAVVGPAPAAERLRPAGNLSPLVTSIGNRYRVLADRQLGALGQPSATDAGRQPAPTAGAESNAGRVASDDLGQAARLSRRMRRLAKTLEVLADDPESAELAEPATVTEIIRAAIADNDEQVRIDFSSLHPASVDGGAVADLVHLLAELIDNAIVSSAGNGTKVVVLGRRSTDGYLLSVVDEGAGMRPGDRESANGRLSSPPPLAQQSPTAFGLPTVGRLADRHEIAVHLLEAATDGLIAKVRIPARLLDGPGHGGRGRTAKAPEGAVAGRAPRRGAEEGAPDDGRRDADGVLVDLTDQELADADLHHDQDGTTEPERRAGPERGSGDRERDGAGGDRERGDRRKRSLAGFAPDDGEDRIAAATASQRAEAARRVVRRSRPQDGGRPRPGGGQDAADGGRSDREAGPE
ncbi:MAG: hypothetical protein GEV08_07910 [Acidimicrobiia bacterium]|nr:hypothetical protein [Acidimicrobiia bacterium]